MDVHVALVLVVLSAMSKPGWHKTTLLPLGLQASLPLPSIACIYGKQSRVVRGRFCVSIGFSSFAWLGLASGIVGVIRKPVSSLFGRYLHPQPDFHRC